MDEEKVTRILTLKERTRPSNTVVLVIDMQNDFCAARGVMASNWGVKLKGLQTLKSKLRQFLSMARLRGVSIVFIRTARGPQDISEPMKELMERHHTNVYPCMEGTWGANFLVGLKPREEDIVIAKKRYSAFWGTDLDTKLRGFGINTIILTGVLTEVCVETTARDGFMRDYHILVVGDLTSSPNEDSHQASLMNVSRFFGMVTTSNELIQAWEG